MDQKQKAEEFLKIASQFSLGHLVTESFHPLTFNLSDVAKQDLPKAFRILQEVDRLALEKMKALEDRLWQMAVDIQDTLNKGHRVFMVGCGATGRLSLVLETLFRQKFGTTKQVISFMAGGDYALIKSVESFEDKVEHAERQLMDLGFGPNDLLLSPTEGGETPFVIGATNLAARVSSRSPYFLYCNPDELLRPIERSRAVIDNPDIKKINLTVGPMAISGSTRMQASTVLMLAIGVGLLYVFKNRKDFGDFYQDFLSRLSTTDYQGMTGLTSLEARLYEEKKFLNYISDPGLAISILTDTTERSPTFSLRGFENRLDPGSHHALSYLFIPDTSSSSEAWAEMLKRAPRPLEWDELNGRIGEKVMLGFDISEHGRVLRSKAIPVEDFLITQNAGKVSFNCRDQVAIFHWDTDPLFNHLMVKMLLNAHSTLIMGLMGRYEGNVMTWVRSSNNKLIDRVARYVLHLLKNTTNTPLYADVIHKIFEEAESLQDNEPIVMKVLDRFKGPK